MAEIELLSPLPLEQCLERLKPLIEDQWRWSDPGRKPLVGRFEGTILRVRKRIPYRNSFQTQLKAELMPEGNRTLFRCRFGAHPFVLIFMALWCALLAAITAPILIQAIEAGTSFQTAGPGLLIPPAMLGFGILLIVVGRLLARNEQQFMLDLFEEELRARPRDGGP